MTRSVIAALSGAVLLAGCAGGVVLRGVATAPPPPVSPAPIKRTATAPAMAPLAIRPVGGPIVGAIPMLPTPVTMVPGATNAAAAGVVPGPSIEALALSEAQARAGLVAFARSCPGLIRRADTTGLTPGAAWQGACDAARARPADARGFFAQWFETAQVGDGKAFATGYYEPEIAGSRVPGPGYAPVYARPRDLVDVDLGQFSTDLKGRSVRGKVQGNKFVPYDDRTAIEEGALADRAAVLGYAVDPVELFFLQIQGSGRLRMPDGTIVRIGYDSQNGREYTGIGALMKARGLLQPGQTSMQGIVRYLHEHPGEGRAIMRENRSYVFFRLLDGAPIGAMGYPVEGQVSAAADPKFIPLGAPVFVSMDRADVGGLWIAQDTGGAIKGANRIDTFWGAGAAAELTAGGMAARGTAFLLLPKGSVARLQAGTGAAAAQP